MVSVRAVYRDGKFQPLDAVDLQDGQVVHLQIVEHSPIQDIIGDMLLHFEFAAPDLDEAAVLQELEQALAGQRPLSEIIIEERREARL